MHVRKLPLRRQLLCPAQFISDAGPALGQFPGSPGQCRPNVPCAARNRTAMGAEKVRQLWHIHVQFNRPVRPSGRPLQNYPIDPRGDDPEAPGHPHRPDAYSSRRQVYRPLSRTLAEVRTTIPHFHRKRYRAASGIAASRKHDRPAPGCRTGPTRRWPAAVWMR